MGLAVSLAKIAEPTGQSPEAALAEIDAAIEVFRASGASYYLEWAEERRHEIADGNKSKPSPRPGPS